MGRTMSARTAPPLVSKNILFASDFFQWMSLIIILLLLAIWSRLGYLLEELKKK